MKFKHIPLLLLVLTCCPACQNKKASATKEIPSEATYTNPLLAVGAEPWAVFHEGKYYYTQGAENKIILWKPMTSPTWNMLPGKKYGFQKKSPTLITSGDRRYTGLTGNGMFISQQMTATWTITTSMS